MSTERLFYGIPLPAEVTSRLATAISAVPVIADRAGPRDNWHLTLRFLGASDPSRKEEISRALRAATLPDAFEARLTSWGAFPRPAAARILWIGLDDPGGHLKALATTLEMAARRAGFAPEDRPFRPHVTLARFRKPTNLRATLEKLPAVDAAIPVDRFVLFRSHLGMGPPRYEPVAVHELPR